MLGADSQQAETAVLSTRALPDSAALRVKFSHFKRRKMNKKTDTKSGSIMERIPFCFFIAVILVVVAFGMHPEIAVQAQQTITFSGAELLGRATDTSITIKIVPDSAIQYYYEFGTSPGVYPGETSTVTAAAAEASSTVISGLTPNTHYYYRMQYNYNTLGCVCNMVK